MRIERRLPLGVRQYDKAIGLPKWTEISNRKLIKGSVCGVRVETIEETLLQEIRYWDKLIDELAKGKAMDKILWS